MMINPLICKFPRFWRNMHLLKNLSSVKDDAVHESIHRCKKQIHTRHRIKSKQLTYKTFHQMRLLNSKSQKTHLDVEMSLVPSVVSCCILSLLSVS